MEYRKKITVYSAILVVLVLTALGGLFFSQQAMDARASQQPLLPTLAPQEATKLIIDNGTPDGKWVITRSGQAWTVTYGTQTYPGNTDRLNSFLKGLNKLTKFRKVADVNNQTKLDAYGLAKPRTVQVLNADGKVLVNLQTGTTDDTGRYDYVRVNGQPQIWLTERNPLTVMELGWNAWTDLSLIPGNLKPDDLIHISLTGTIHTLEKKTYSPFDLIKTIKDKKPQWKLANGTFPKTAQDYVDGLPGFKVNSYLKDGETYDPSKDTQGVLTVQTQTKTYVFHIGMEQKDGRIPASDGTRKFWLSTWSLDQILFHQP